MDFQVKLSNWLSQEKKSANGRKEDQSQKPKMGSQSQGPKLTATKGKTNFIAIE